MMRRAALVIALLGPAVAVFFYSVSVAPLDPTLTSVVAALPIIVWVAVRSTRRAARR